MANLCVTVNGSGAEDGSDWDNALPASFIPIRGNDYYLADGDYGGTKAFSTAESGTTIIGIYKATVSEHVTDTGWSPSMGDGYAEFDSITVSTGYWTIDGKQGGGPSDWEFSSGLGFYLNSDTNNLKMLNVSASVGNITFRHINAESSLIEHTNPASGYEATGVTTNDIEISYCRFYRIWGPMIFQQNSDGFLVQYCLFDTNKSSGSHHSELNSKAGDTLNEIWRWNIFKDIVGTAVFAGINNGTVDGFDCYGNIFFRHDQPITYETDGVTDFPEMHNAKVFNNTFLETGTYAGKNPQSQGGFRNNTDNSTCISRNNLFYNNDFNAFQFQFDTNTHVWADGNIRSSAGGIDKDSEILAAHTDGEQGSGNPFNNYIEGDIFSSDLAANTESGYNTGEELPGNDFDMLGNARGVNGVWTRGAIQMLPAPFSKFYPTHSTIVLF